MNAHIEVNENTKPKKSLIRKRLLLKNKQISGRLQCVLCNEIFTFPKYGCLKTHILSHGINVSIQENFRKVGYVIFIYLFCLDALFKCLL